MPYIGNTKDEYDRIDKIVTINQNCITCASDGHDAQMVIKLFKTACLSYKTSDMNYRDHLLSRAQIIQLRRNLIDQITTTLSSTKLVKSGL